MVHYLTGEFYWLYSHLTRTQTRLMYENTHPVNEWKLVCGSLYGGVGVGDGVQMGWIWGGDGVQMGWKWGGEVIMGI